MELEKEDLIALVKGTQPYYSIMDKDYIKGLGHYTGGFHDTWTWNDTALNALSEKSLLFVYNECKKSWKKLKG